MWKFGRAKRASKLLITLPYLLFNLHVHLQSRSAIIAQLLHYTSVNKATQNTTALNV